MKKKNVYYHIFNTKNKSICFTLKTLYYRWAGKYIALKSCGITYMYTCVAEWLVVCCERFAEFDIRTVMFQQLNVQSFIHFTVITEVDVDKLSVRTVKQI